MRTLRLILVGPFVVLAALASSSPRLKVDL
jgi:hypothetical protein